MPVSTLLATAVASRFFGTIFPLSDAANIAAINSDDADSLGSLTTSAPINTLNSFINYTVQDLPAAAGSAFITNVTVENTSRRAGGSTLGQYRTHLRRPVVGRTFGPIRQPGAPGAPGIARFFDDYTRVIPGPEVTWDFARINESESGWTFTFVGTGINVYFLGYHVTWQDESGGSLGAVIGASWLPPLILAGLGGLNLFYERKDVLAVYLLDLYRAAGVTTWPAIGHRREWEELAWKLFRRPRYCFVGR